jgi:hypothetical protein
MGVEWMIAEPCLQLVACMAAVADLMSAAAAHPTMCSSASPALSCPPSWHTQAALNGETVVNGFTDSLASTLTATTSTAFTTPNVLATEGLNLATDTQEVLGGLAVDGSRLDRVLPDSISTAAGATNIAGTYESTNYVPRFTYIIGANFGAPFGLATNDRK